MIAEPLYRRILSGEGTGWAGPVRGLLTAASWGYAAVVAGRNARRDRRGPVHRAAVPVISVGNLTVGGTGKTPMIVELVRRLTAMGRKPAVLARGYGAAPGGANDEARLICRHVPEVAYIADADRARAADRAVRERLADVLLLDDGFQHRRLARDLDMVLIDATCPFGYGRLLPRGLLREPAEGLSRADAVVLTRCDQIGEADVGPTQRRLGELAPRAMHLKCHHSVTSVERLDGRGGEGGLGGRRVALFAAVGNPRAFAATVASLGGVVVGVRWFPDHHRYSAADVEALRRRGTFPPHDALVTTEKDAVKLAEVWNADGAPVLVVRVAIEFPPEDGARLQELLERAVSRVSPS